MHQPVYTVVNQIFGILKILHWLGYFKKNKNSMRETSVIPRPSAEDP